MILTDTINQPKALLIYAILGVTLGILYMLNYFTCAYLIKSQIYRHTTQALYVFVYGIAFFCVTYVYFDYDLKIYHALISLFFTILVAMLLYLPILKHKDALTEKCDNARTKVLQSKLAKRVKK